MDVEKKRSTMSTKPFSRYGTTSDDQVQIGSGSQRKADNAMKKRGTSYRYASSEGR
jgi:hypothetical protein